VSVEFQGEIMKKTIIIFTIIALALCSGVLVIPNQSRIVKSANLPQDQAVQVDGEPLPSAPKRLQSRRVSAWKSAEAGEPEKDDPLARADAEYRARGRITSPMIQEHLREAKHQRDDYPERFSAAKPDRGVPSWRSLGPTSDEFIQNAVTLREIDSGRLRTILPHPSGRHLRYVVRCSKRTA